MGLHHRPAEGRRPATTTLTLGMASGLLTSVLLQPFDRLKTLSQQLEWRKVPVRSLFVNTVRDGGLLQLWKGLTPSLIRVVPGVALHFTIVETLRPYVISDDAGVNTRLVNSYFLLGFGSRCLVVGVMQPVTLLKTLYESSFPVSRQSVSELVNRHGLTYLWRGLVPTLMRDAPFSGLYLMFYRYGLHRLEVDETHHAPTTRAMCGIAAGALACLITHPFDALKTAVQLYPDKFHGSTARAALSLYSQEGVGAFFRGFALRATRRTLASAMSWALFDEMISRKGSE